MWLQHCVMERGQQGTCRQRAGDAAQQAGTASGPTGARGGYIHRDDAGTGPGGDRAGAGGAGGEPGSPGSQPGRAGAHGRAGEPRPSGDPAGDRSPPTRTNASRTRKTPARWRGAPARSSSSSKSDAVRRAGWLRHAPRCPRTAINSQWSPTAALSEPEANQALPLVSSIASSRRACAAHNRAHRASRTGLAIAAWSGTGDDRDCGVSLTARSGRGGDQGSGAFRAPVLCVA
jgi:hypothetical protein